MFSPSQIYGSRLFLCIPSSLTWVRCACLSWPSVTSLLPRLIRLPCLLLTNSFVSVLHNIISITFWICFPGFQLRKTCCRFNTVSNFLVSSMNYNHVAGFFFFLWCNSPAWARAALFLRFLDHSDTPQWVGLLWTRDRPVADISTWQHITFTRDRHPCPPRDSNPQSQQASLRALGHGIGRLAYLHERNGTMICRNK